MKKYPFTLITRRGEVGLIETVREGETIRCMLPIELLVGENIELSESQINAGIPYGLPFGEFLHLSKFTGPLIEKSMHNNGIWTLEDLRTKPQQVIRVLQSVYGIELASLIQQTEEYITKSHEAVDPKPAVKSMAVPKQKKEKQNG
jgi:hypothetical protein